MKHIGVTTSYFAPPVEERRQRSLQMYLDMLEDAGAKGEPLWLPPHEETTPPAEREEHAAKIADQMDGLILSGGADLPPLLWGEEPLPDAHLNIICPERLSYETMLVPAFLKRKKPVLGICYGCQFLNVWRGGSILQDIPTLWPNPIRHDNDVLHPVRVDKGSRLHRITGMQEFEVCSYHHQAIGRVSVTGTVTAWAPDHSPESIEFEDTPFLIGVQWHPERTRDSLATQRLIDAFLRAGQNPCL